MSKREEEGGGAPSERGGKRVRDASPPAVPPPGHKRAKKEQGEAEEEPLVRVTNVVAAAFVGHEVDLLTFARGTKNTQYCPRVNPAVTLRRRNPRCTVEVYASGKLKVTGALTEAEARLGARKVARAVQLACPGRGTRLANFRVLTVLGVADAGRALRLEDMARATPDSMYDPEVSPALQCELDAGVSAQVFASGKVLVSGPSPHAVQEAFLALLPTLDRFAKHV